MSYFEHNNAFGIVTVMDVKVYKAFDPKDGGETAKQYLERLNGANGGVLLAEIDHMQVATLSTEGPSITINGGKYNNPLIKYGKTARCEMTDALGQADALVALGGAEIDSDGNISITDKFGAPVTIVGESFVVDQKTGKHIPVKVVLYKFLPDSTPSFAFDSGNAATFDLNGDLMAVDNITLPKSTDNPEQGWEDCQGSTGVFFSFVPYGCALEGAEAVTYHRDLVLAEDQQSPTAAEMDEFQFGKPGDTLIINNTFTYKKDAQGVWQLQA